MNRRISLVLVTVAAMAASIAYAQNSKDGTPTKGTTATAKGTTKGATPVQGVPLPPGMTEEDMKDMQKCMEAAAPGPMQAKLMEGVGTWTGTNTMWMKPGAEPMKSPCTTVITSIMDGRFTKCEATGDMGGMPFHGLGIYGYDNVTKQFQSTWLDNCGSGMMNGKGELASDGTMTWTYNYTCPITNKPVTMREVVKHPTKDTVINEMYGIDPKSGKEFKMMELSMTRKPGAMTKSN
ncbi:MAG: DUF1579 domain-containing protein [Planctomycetes bacterium]|nr:DUF1579 domain-containing protein [Planctomycetota bacterium]